MFDYKCVWSALYPISNHSHIRQLQFATHAFSQQVLQQAVQISICQWSTREKTKRARVLGQHALEIVDLAPLRAWIINCL